MASHEVASGYLLLPSHIGVRAVRVSFRVLVLHDIVGLIIENVFITEMFTPVAIPILVIHMIEVRVLIIDALVPF